MKIDFFLFSFASANYFQHQSTPALPLRRTEADTRDYLIFQVHEEEIFRQDVEETNLQEATFVTDQRLEQIRQETNKDASLQTLMTSQLVGLLTNCRGPIKWPSLSWYNKHYSPLHENRDDSKSPPFPPWNPVQKTLQETSRVGKE